MAQVLIRQNRRPFVLGNIHAEKNQDIEVENDETHWVGHDRFQRIVKDPSQLRGRFRITIPSANGRTETVDKNESLTAQSRDSLAVWTQLAHALFNLKEFLYIQ